MTRAFIYTPRRQARFVVGREGLDEPEWCDVLDLGDGVQIQAALDAAAILAAETGGRMDVFVRPGIYTLTAPLVVTAQVRLWCAFLSVVLVAPTTGDHRVLTVQSFGSVSGMFVQVPSSTAARTGDSWIELEQNAEFLDSWIVMQGSANVFDTVTRGVRALDLGLGRVERVFLVGMVREFFALPDAFVGIDVQADAFVFFLTAASVRDCNVVNCDGGFKLGGNVDAAGLLASACSAGILCTNRDSGLTPRGPRVRGFEIHASPITLGFGVVFDGAPTVQGATAIQGRIENSNAGLALAPFVGVAWGSTAERCTISLCDLVGDPTNDTGILNAAAPNPRALDCAFVDFAIPSSGPAVDTSGSLFLP